MTNSEVFDRATAVFGGRFHRETAPDPALSVYRKIEDRAQDLIGAVRREIPELPDIHFDYIASGRINAVAFKAGGRYFVGLNTGTVFMLRQVIGRMLSDARLYREVGNPAVESTDLGPLVDYVPDAEVMYQRERLLTPNDPVRVLFAEFLEDQALMFLVGHELVHIVHGHVDYLNVKRQQRMTIELAAFGGWSDEERIERQALEQDADRRSIISRIDSLRFTFAHPKRTVVPWRPETKHAVEMLADWTLSVHVLFRLFGDIRLNHTRLADSPYPPFPLRRVVCDVAAWDAVGKLFGDEWKPLASEALNKARTELEIAFATMLGEESSAAGLQAALAADSIVHADALREYWHAELREVLQPFAYTALR